MNPFSQALEEIKKKLPDVERAADNLLMDRQSKVNPFGISGKLEQSLDDGIESRPICLVIKDHSILRKPELHTEAVIEEMQIKRVMSKLTFMRWHLGDGRIISDYTAPADSGWEDIENIIAGGKKNIKGNMMARQSIKSEELKGTSGREGSAVFWTWDEDGLDYQGTGKQYIMELALSEYELISARNDEVVVEVSLEKEEHPEKFYRPTGLDSFFPDTMFRPNIDARECFGRTWPIPPADPQKKHPEVISAPIRYAELQDDTHLEVTFFKY